MFNKLLTRLPLTPRDAATIQLTSTGAAYAGAVLAVVFASAGTVAMRGWMGPSVSVLFFPAVIIVAIYGGYGPALLATLLSTFSLAFFFVQPYYSLQIGADDVIRLAVFAAVAVVTASISSARKLAEDAQRKAMSELRGALTTLQKVSGWPVFGDVSLGGGASQLLAHAASVVGCTRAVAVWEAEEEPWVYVAVSSGSADAVTRYPPTALMPVVPAGLETASFVSAEALDDRLTAVASQGGVITEWHGLPVHRDLVRHLQGAGIASAPVEVERLSGRLFFSGFDSATRELIPLVDVVAREVGNSLERLHLHDRLQQIAVREDRIRVARDLHDGVLQALTGIRLRLQALADGQDASASVRDSLLAVERAIAIEQRELRMFIEDLKPVARPAGVDGSVAHGLEELRARLAGEWNLPIVVRVKPASLAVPAAAEQTLRLMVREAVVNALKHAHPSRVTVDVESNGARALRVVVSNDGRGFPFRGRLEHDELIAANAGPVSLRERLVSLGGALAIESTATGSRVEMTVPISGNG
jgi:signal transduction histidine kinase